MPSRKLSGLTLTIALVASSPCAAAALFVSNERDNTVTVLDTTSLSVVKTIPVGTRPRGIVITPDHKQVLVCNGDSDDISVIDANSFEVVRKLAPGPDPETLALSPDGSIVYVSNEDDSMATMLDFKSGAVIARVPVGIYAMAGMVTQLHLIASSPGTLMGENTQFNGDHFQDEKFVVDVLTQTDFDHWVTARRADGLQFDAHAFETLAVYGTVAKAKQMLGVQDRATLAFKNVDARFFASIVDKYNPGAMHMAASPPQPAKPMRNMQ